MLFAETSETNKGHLHSLFFVFAADEAFFGKFLWLPSETGNANYSFWYIPKTTNLKIRL